jgi:hypothetical protein
MERDPTQTLLSTGLGMQTFSHSNTDHDFLKMSLGNFSPSWLVTSLSAGFPLSIPPSALK